MLIFLTIWWSLTALAFIFNVVVLVYAIKFKTNKVWDAAENISKIIAFTMMGIGTILLIVGIFFN